MSAEYGQGSRPEARESALLLIYCLRGDIRCRFIHRAGPGMSERRRAARYNFGAIAEVVDTASLSELICVTRDLSLSGCFLKTKTPLPKGTEVRVRIMSSGADFAAIGNVTGNITHEGMGIEFVRIEPNHIPVIEKWLSLGPEEAPRVAEARADERASRGIPISVSGHSPSGDAFTEESEAQSVMADGALLRLSATVSAGQVVRIKNRLTRREHDCRVLFVDPKPRPGEPKLLAVEFLEPAENFWETTPQTRQ